MAHIFTNVPFRKLHLRYWHLKLYRAINYRLKKLRRWIENSPFDYIYFGKSLDFKIENKFSSQGSANYQATGLWVLKYVFRHFKIYKDDIIVDVGCGTGRVLKWLRVNGNKNKMYGIEINEELANFAREKLKKDQSIKIISGNVLDNLPKDATLFYIFNPFNVDMVKQLISKLDQIYIDKSIRIIYYNPQGIREFAKDPKWDISVFPQPDMPSTYRPRIPWCTVIKKSANQSA